MGTLEQRRPLGRTGVAVTRLGIGDLADRNVPIEACVATLCRALDAGPSLVDTAPGYEDGYSEQIVGRALQGRRDGVFVIDKIDHLEAPVAPQVTASLGRLGLSGVDLLVFHNCSTAADWDRLVAPGGGFDQLDEEIKAGRARFAGISSHHPDVLHAAIQSGRCDVLMFPIGPYVDRRYDTEVLPLARSHGIGTICFKTFGAGKLLGDTEGYQRPLASRPRGKRSSGGADDDGLGAAAPERRRLPALHADARPRRRPPGPQLPERTGRGVRGGRVVPAADACADGGRPSSRQRGDRREGRVLVESHGFCVLSERVHVENRCTAFYDRADEVAIAWNDPQIGIEWPIREPMLSTRDASAATPRHRQRLPAELRGLTPGEAFRE